MCSARESATEKLSQVKAFKVARKASSVAWKKSISNEQVRRASKERKAVSFSEDPDVFFRHVTREELDKSWYHERELQFFKDDCRRTAREYQSVMGDITRLDQAKTCLRGIEHHLSRSTLLTKRMAISVAVHSVLEAQKCAGTQNSERLGRVSKVTSEASARRAYMTAAIDASLCELDS